MLLKHPFILEAGSLGYTFELVEASKTSGLGSSKDLAENVDTGSTLDSLLPPMLTFTSRTTKAPTTNKSSEDLQSGQSPERKPGSSSITPIQSNLHLKDLKIAEKILLEAPTPPAALVNFSKVMKRPQVVDEIYTELSLSDLPFLNVADLDTFSLLQSSSDVATTVENILTSQYTDNVPIILSHPLTNMIRTYQFHQEQTRLKSDSTEIEKSLKIASDYLSVLDKIFNKG